MNNKIHRIAILIRPALHFHQATLTEKKPRKLVKLSALMEFASKFNAMVILAREGSYRSNQLKKLLDLLCYQILALDSHLVSTITFSEMTIHFSDQWIWIFHSQKSKCQSSTFQRCLRLKISTEKWIMKWKIAKTATWTKDLSDKIIFRATVTIKVET